MTSNLGQRPANVLVLAVVTRRFRVPILWVFLPHGGYRVDKVSALLPYSGVNR